MNTPFSTVLMVFRETSTIVASSACVRFRRARSSRRRLCRRSAIEERATLQIREEKQRCGYAWREDEIHRFAGGESLQPGADEHAHRDRHRDPVAGGECHPMVAARDIVIDE